MEKKLIVFVALLFCLSTVFAVDSIQSYAVKTNVNLGQNVTAFGVFQDDLNLHGDNICSFYLTETSTGFLVDRADDDFTDATGRFAMSFPINEPSFKRDQNYSVQVVCGEANDTKTFVVNNFETIADATAQNFEFITDNENLDTIAILGFFLGCFTIIGMFVFALKKWGERFG